MSVTTVSSRDFNQELGRVKQAAKKGPVFITDRGRPSFVLLNIAEYNKIAAKGKSLSDVLAMPEGTSAFDYEFEELRSLTPHREIDLG